jgi:hypothetical protein
MCRIGTLIYYWDKDRKKKTEKEGHGSIFMLGSKSDTVPQQSHFRPLGLLSL